MSAVPAARETASIPRRIDDLLATGAASPAATIAFPGERASVATIDARADDYAAELNRLGAVPGDRVALWLPPSLELVAATFGVARAGCVAVPVSDRFRAGELVHVLRTAEITVFLTTAADPYVDRVGILRTAVPELPDDLDGELAVEPLPFLRRVLAAVPPPSTAAPARVEEGGEIAMLMFTSGTSAAPKACVLKHGSLLAMATGLARESYRLVPESVVWSPLPLFHIAGQVAMMATFSAGASFVHSGVFSNETTLPLLAAERATHALVGFETIWMQLIDAAERDAVDLSSITFGLSANGAAQLRTLHERLPWVTFVGNYGSTEGCGHLAIGRVDEPEEVRLAGGGLPLPGSEVRVVDADSGSPLAAGEPGEIQFRGVHRFAGYFHDEAADAAALSADGWFRSGDIGVLDGDGRLYFRGRLKDMIKVGGENVAAPEVEAYLSGHPSVRVAAVVGASDDYYGEVVAAFVELTPGRESSEAELIDFCLDRIATYKVPRHVRFVTEWPMSGTKIKKDVLARRLADELGAAGITEAPRLRTRRAR